MLSGLFRGPLVRGRALALDFYPSNALAVHLDHAESITAVVETFSATRNESQLVEYEPADRSLSRIFRQRDPVLRIETAPVQPCVKNNAPSARVTGRSTTSNSS